ncbi:NfeD family protein [Microbacterium sp. Marseille-Q6965]|uniref:NfeD family protein n=1 Tax=Microbacterium sp. Marseille-Q6965 TaxID=2965072 RepID=UPI0021B83938|nr:NfeD family protein [Microbacterium sp. Marseille-Q6965]
MDIADYAWIAWLAVIAIVLVIEMLSGEFTFLMIAIGAAIGLTASLLGAPIWLQIIIAAVAAVALLLFLRPPLLRRLRRPHDPMKFNVDALLGMAGTVQQPVTPIAGVVKLADGQTWSARTTGALEIPAGAVVYVQSVKGALVYVGDRPPAVDPTH